MHSFERTLIARLGFNDADRKTPIHDQAVRYLKEKADRLLAVVEGGCRCVAIRCEAEAVITKGIGQYAQHIGFIDLLVNYAVETGDKREFGQQLVVEVKATPVPQSDVLRQLNLYKAHSAYGTRFALVTHYDLSPADINELADAGVHHFRLGPDFAAWLSRTERSETKQCEI